MELAILGKSFTLPNTERSRRGRETLRHMWRLLGDDDVERTVETPHTGNKVTRGGIRYQTMNDATMGAFVAGLAICTTRGWVVSASRQRTTASFDPTLPFLMAVEARRHSS